MKKEIILLVENWIKRAESDLKIGKDEIATEEPATDGICFHMQQCVEKYLKAYLIFHQKHFRKTHNIAKLVELCKETDREFEEIYRFGASNLTDFAVEIRYGEDFYFPTVEEAKEAIEIAEKVKAFVIQKLRAKGFNPV
jgi:HEPN domain-containing protein